MAQQVKPSEQAMAIGAGGSDMVAEAALVRSTATAERADCLSANPLAAQIPIELDVAVPVRGFRVRNLLALGRGTVIGSTWLQGEDLPLAARGSQLAWSEFEVIDQKLAVRITRLI